MGKRCRTRILFSLAFIQYYSVVRNNSTKQWAHDNKDCMFVLLMLLSLMLMMFCLPSFLCCFNSKNAHRERHSLHFLFRLMAISFTEKTIICVCVWVCVFHKTKGTITHTHTHKRKWMMEQWMGIVYTDYIRWRIKICAHVCVCVCAPACVPMRQVRLPTTHSIHTD